MNTRLMFSSKTDLWETPQWLFDELDREFHFTLDVCALPENAKCERYYTPEMDGLAQLWDGVCWCNPPYGRTVGAWVRKARETAAAGHTVVMLLPARTDTRWFHEDIYRRERTEVRFLRGRLRFGGAGNSAPFPSMVVVFRPPQEAGGCGHCGMFDQSAGYLAEHPEHAMRYCWYCGRKLRRPEEVTS